MKTKIQITTILFLTLIILTLAHVRLAYAFSFNPEPPTASKWTLYPVDMPNHSKDQITYINYAYRMASELSEYERREFTMMFKTENGEISPFTRHDPSNNVVGVDWGFCGINDYWHPEIVNDPRFFEWKWQISECLRLYKEGVTFYGLNQIHKVKHHFKFNENIL